MGKKMFYVEIYKSSKLDCTLISLTKINNKEQKKIILMMKKLNLTLYMLPFHLYQSINLIKWIMYLVINFKIKGKQTEKSYFVLGTIFHTCTVQTALV